MRGRRTVSRYRAMDLTMLAVILALFETLAVTAARRWFPNEPYTVSVTPAVTAIVLMRWGPWAGLHAALGGAALCLASGAGLRHYAIYVLGNEASLLALCVLRRAGAERIRQSALKSLGLALAVTLLMQLGRALMALILGASPLSTLGFFTTDVITLLFTLVLTGIARRLDGVFEDQRHYLLRIHRQQTEEDSDEG